MPLAWQRQPTFPIHVNTTKGHPELVSGSFHSKILQGIKHLIFCFILIMKKILNLRTRINRAFTSFRTLLVLFRMTIWCAQQGIRHSENLENFCECNEHLIFLLFRICFHYPPFEIIDFGSQPYGIQSHSIRFAHWFELAPQVGHIMPHQPTFFFDFIKIYDCNRVVIQWRNLKICCIIFNNKNKVV